MRIFKQVTSLEKVRENTIYDLAEIFEKKCLKGERFSYQIAVQSDDQLHGIIEIKSALEDNIKVYMVLNAAMDKPITDNLAFNDINYLTKEPGLMPDILKPISENNNFLAVWTNSASLWIDVNIPNDIEAGEYDIQINYKNIDSGELIFCKTMGIIVGDKEILPQNLIYTRWIYLDCIADYHNVEVFSDEHWKLIEAYIRQAADVGINMILVPVHTPPLDTAVGTTRRCVQLVDIEKQGDKYIFGFDNFKKYIDICKRCGIKYYEIAHLFSQWGANFTPNIKVAENGVTDYMFGWHVAANSAKYTEFLKQYITAISKELSKEGISENTYFHISDEPHLEKIEAYKSAAQIVRPLIGDSKTMDGLSNYDFYEKGLVKCPVTIINEIKSFLEHNIEDQWVYYCCFPQSVYPNSTLAMPLSRVRILGVLLYKYNIKGFLHWGLNYYNGQLSRYHINPYVTTSADGRFPSGDPFILYPSKDGAYGSIRGKVTFDAIEDMKICQTLERYIGREAVIKMIDDVAGMNVDFENFPIDKYYLIKLRKKMIDEILIHNKLS